MSRILEPNTPFQEGIRKLVHRGDSVPDGWKIPYEKTIAGLHAVACEGRANIELDGPLMADCNLYVTHRGGDRVVAGLLGRLERTTAQTCEVCGRPGKLRVFGQTLKVLCPVCAAPRLALQAVSQLLRDLGLADERSLSEPLTFDETQMQLRPMLLAQVWEPLIDHSGDEPPTYVTSLSQLQALRPRLEAVRQTLLDTLEAGHGS